MYDSRNTYGPGGAAGGFDFRRRLHGRLTRRSRRLMSYRRLLWDSYRSLRLEPDLEVLNVNGTQALDDFLAEKRGAPVKLTSVNLGASALSPTEALPFEAGAFDRVFIDSPAGAANRIFFANEIKRVVKPDGVVVVIDQEPGLGGVYNRTRGDLLRLPNIHGFRRRAAALSKLAYSTPALLMAGLIDPSSETQTSATRALTDNGLALTAIGGAAGDRVFVGGVDTTADPDPLISNFVTYAKKYDLRFPGMVSKREQIVNVTLDDLRRDSAFLEQLAHSYQEIFGSSEVWSEGAYCNRDPKHLLSLEAYNEKLEAGDTKCACGGAFRPCYTADDFKRLITSQLTKSDKYNPCCSLYVDDGRVTGFMWGAVATVEDAVVRILNIPNWVDSDDWRAFVDRMRARLLADFRLKPTDKLFYIDDLGVTRESRRGVEPMMGLCGQAFSHAVANECQKALCWTSRQAPLYKITRYCAFKEVLTNDDGLAFMYCDDIVPALKILQHDPRSMLPIMLKNARLAGGKRTNL